MDESDRVELARDNLFAAIDQWYRMTCHVGVTSFGVDKHLTETYKDWLDASKPPGDPRKEWVDAEKMKPNDVFQPVLVKTILDKTGLANWVPGRNFDGVERSWHVQLFMEGWYWTKEDGVTHWRYIPNMED